MVGKPYDPKSTKEQLRNSGPVVLYIRILGKLQPIQNTRIESIYKQFENDRVGFVYFWTMNKQSNIMSRMF